MFFVVLFFLGKIVYIFVGTKPIVVGGWLTVFGK